MTTHKIIQLLDLFTRSAHKLGALSMLCAMLWMTTGCATSTARTARQLEAGNVVASGGIDYPGAGPVPHVHGQAMYGVGDVGDVSAHVGTTGATINGGLGARAYLGEHLTMGVQGDAMLGLEILEGPFSVLSGTLDVTTAARKETAPYVGLSVRGHRYDGAYTDDPEVVFQPGIVAGLDVLLWDDFGLLFEGRASPFYYSPSENMALFAGPEAWNATPLGQVSVSLYKRWERAPEIAPSRREDVNPWSVED